MSFETSEILGRFHRALVTEIRKSNPAYLDGPFTVAEIYQNLVPYRTHRDEIGVEMNADYEDALLRLLAGEGDYLVIESKEARQTIREELDASNPNTGIFRDFAAADVRLNPQMLGMVEDVVASGGDAVAPEVEVEEAYETFDEVFGADGPEEEAERGEPVVEDMSFETVEEPSPFEEETVEEEAAEQAEESAPFETEPAGVETAPEPGVVAVAGEEIDQAEVSEVPGTCPWCRESLPDRGELNYCPFCGSNLTVIPCSECGEELELNWRFCVACGTEVKR
jgi:hypothetical protein